MDAFVSIPRQNAVYCLNCDAYSVALKQGRCGVCQSEAIVSAADAFEGSSAFAVPHHPAFSNPQGPVLMPLAPHR